MILEFWCGCSAWERKQTRKDRNGTASGIHKFRTMKAEVSETVDKKIAELTMGISEAKHRAMHAYSPRPDKVLISSPDLDLDPQPPRTRPDTITDPRWQLPPLESLIHKPQPNHKLNPRQPPDLAPINQSPHFLQHVLG